MVIYLEQGADLHTAQLMPLPLTVSCFSKIQIGFTFLVLAHLGSPGQRAIKRVCECVYVFIYASQSFVSIVIITVLCVVCRLIFRHLVFVKAALGMDISGTMLRFKVRF